MDITRKMTMFINEESAYREFFDAMLKKYGVSSPDELSDKEKKKFFDEVDKKWNAKKERD